MEKALVYELNCILEINNKIFPTNAPEGQVAPYIVYQTSSNYGKTLEGINKEKTCHVLVNVLSNSYSEMKSLTKKVKDIIVTFPLRFIGIGEIYIKDLDMHDITETFERELKLHRGIIPFTVYYKEE